MWFIFKILITIIIILSPISTLWLSDEFIHQDNNECIKFSVNCFITILTFLSGILLIIMSLKYDTNNISNSKKDLLKIKLF